MPTRSISKKRSDATRCTSSRSRSRKTGLPAGSLPWDKTDACKTRSKTPMPERDAILRSHDFEEVNEGYGIAHAQFEAERCLRCQDPICIDGCPVRVPIPDFIHKVASGDMRGAAAV